jgi:predicted lactoylglutathione lyase
MHNQIFVNLPIKDLPRSVRFFESLGYTFNPQFTDENATCLILGENLFAMLLVEPYFRTFIEKDVSDAHRATEVLLAVPLDSREAVDALMAKALAAGAREPRPAQDLGFMYQRSYEDLDGHLWEVFHMSEMPPG